MNRCLHCGFENQGNNAFCLRCGNPLLPIPPSAQATVINQAVTNTKASQDDSYSDFYQGKELNKGASFIQNMVNQAKVSQDGSHSHLYQGKALNKGASIIQKYLYIVWIISSVIIGLATVTMVFRGGGFGSVLVTIVAGVLIFLLNYLGYHVSTAIFVTMQDIAKIRICIEQMIENNN